MNTDEVRVRIEVLLRERITADDDESEAIVDYLISELSEVVGTTVKIVNSVIDDWMEVLDLEKQTVEYDELIASLCAVLNVEQTDQDSDGNSDGDGDSDDAALPDECELCLRQVKLTKHHLIPKEVHKNMMKRGAADRELLSQTIDICRPCHNAIHGFASNKVLAMNYNTLQKLSEAEAIQKFIKYINTKRAPNKSRVIDTSILA